MCNIDASSVIILKRKSACRRSPHEIAVFRKLRQAMGRLIDPDTAEIMCKTVQTLDHYGIGPKVPEALRQDGLEYFARAHGSEKWVCFEDLPDATAKALVQKHGLALALPTPSALPQAA